MNKRSLKIFILISFLPISVAAQEKNDLRSFFEFFTQGILNVGINAARNFVDVRYDDIGFDIITKNLLVSDIKFSGYPNTQFKNCVVTVGRMEFATPEIFNFVNSNVSIEVNNLKVSNLCFDLMTRGMMSSVGIQEIEVPELFLEFNYFFPDSSMEMEIFFELQDYAVFELYSEIPYISSRIPTDYQYDPLALQFKEISLNVINVGGWEKITPLIPTELLDPQYAGEVLTDMLGALVGEILLEYNLKNQTEEAWQSFVNNSSGLGLQVVSRNPQGSFIGASAFGDLEKLKAAFDVSIYSIDSSNDDLISVKDLNELVDQNWMDWSSEKKFEFGQMLYNGTSAPKNEALALELLQGAADDNFGEAVSLIADIKFEENPILAYQMMLKLGPTSRRSKATFLNEIEQALTIEQILEQQKVISKYGENRFPDGMDYLSGAMSFLRGQDITRNYRLAYYGALQASARGSSSGKRLVKRIENFAENRGIEDKEAWTEMLFRVQSDVFSDWKKSIEAQGKAVTQ